MKHSDSERRLEKPLILLSFRTILVLLSRFTRSGRACALISLLAQTDLQSAPAEV
jgi:hypothetical protein